ncbi:Nramp family divalent metal transporter [Saccharopolyspora sp. HNM0983]|uniref:Nramp family divalent metal transporter n=1 Tax=Saccharopolyspora montiporae TaxID=2781240 RepID=A0A929FYJ2_9PSEU|nr:Nramp family divalent metal transporter [Saccharopolyspora sp. HNM0983]MBE9375861.1 Nramp family divalent metal transporter [Saccharopolyspora sp. HNM0983]
MGTPVTTGGDPYVLTADGIKEPPTGWRASMRYLGPGLIVSASIVGSGELIATTALGAEAGFALLWLVVLSTAVKVAVQAELARWTICTGNPALTGFNDVPPKIGRLGWINVLWTVMALSKLLQIGGIVGGVAVALSILIPVGGDPLGGTSLTAWTVIVVVGSIALLYSSGYRLVERGAFALVAVFSVVTVLIALGLPFTPFHYGTAELLTGLSLTIPAGALGAAIAMFGITGVGADEITFYTYWCVEKGYARWAGPPDGSAEWAARARGWIRVMYKDVLLSWLIYTFATLAFYIMGAAVLHPQGLVLDGNDMITTLSAMYTGVLGEWVAIAFLIGAVAVLGSTLWASIPSWSRMYTNLLAVLGWVDWDDPRSRQRSVRAFTVVLPVLWGATYLFVSEPVVMVQIGGTVTGIFLPAVVLATWYLRGKQVDRRLHGGTAFTVLLVASSVAIVALGIYTVLNVFGIGTG